MAKILMSFLGELSKFHDSDLANTPDGHRHIRNLVVEELLARGHEIVCLQKKLGNGSLPGVEWTDDLPDADLVYSEWRWETYKGLTQDVVRHREMLQHYHGKIPIIVFDLAHQIKAEDEIKWPKMTVVDSCINPRFLARKRERLFLCSDFKEYAPIKDPRDIVNYGYVGNDYNRPGVFERYYIEPAVSLRNIGVQTTVWGNWIDRSSDRPEPHDRISKTHDVMFCGRVSFRDSMYACNKFLATTHICMPIHEVHGNVTARFTECICTWTPAMVPATFLEPDILGREWIVSCPEDVVKNLKKFKDMTIDQRRDVVESQKRELTSRHDMSVETTIQFLESYIGVTP